MMLHGAGSPKPTLLFSNMLEIGDLDLGVLTKHEKETRTTAKLTRALDAIGYRCSAGMEILSIF